MTAQPTVFHEMLSKQWWKKQGRDGCPINMAKTNATPEQETPMDLRLTNKKALVTGSTAGIGFAIASLLAQEGAAVVVNGRSLGRVEEAVRRIQRENKDAQATGVAADLGTREGVGLLTRAVPTLDIL